MRTDEEILARIAEVQARDWMCTETNDLLFCLPFEKAKSFLRNGTKAEDWEVLPRDRDAVVARILDYMAFAWDKANNFRGLSAGRSMSHFAAWTWLAGDDLGDLLNYEFYGKDNLVRICQHYGWDASQWDDGVRKNSED